MSTNIDVSFYGVYFIPFGERFIYYYHIDFESSFSHNIEKIYCTFPSATNKLKFYNEHSIIGVVKYYE